MLATASDAAITSFAGARVCIGVIAVEEVGATEVLVAGAVSGPLLRNFPFFCDLSGPRGCLLRSDLLDM